MPLAPLDHATSVLAQFDLLQPALTDARAAALAGRSEDALAQVFARVRSHFHSLAPRLPAPLDLAETCRQAERVLRGGVALLGGAERPIGDPVNWWACWDQDTQHSAHLGYFYWATPLAQAYQDTGDERFAARWFELVEDFLGQLPYGTEKLSYFPSRTPLAQLEQTCDNGESDHDCPQVWISLAAHHRIDQWLESLARLAGSRLWEQPRVLPVLLSLAQDHAFLLIANSRSAFPNQYLGGALALVRLAIFLPELRIASAACAIGVTRLEDALAKQVLPDGGDLEQSPNYSANLILALRSFLPLLPAEHRLRRLIHTCARRRLSFLRHLTQPDGRMPDLAKTHASTFPQHLFRWAPDLLQDDAPDDAVIRPSATTSAVAPHGGFAVLRGDDGERSDWLLFKHSATQQGHGHADALSLCLCARGRRLLVDSGHYSYSLNGDMDRVMNAYSGITASHSAISVDGRSQSRLPPSAADHANDLVAVGSSHLECVRAAFRGGFGPSGEIPVQHERAVIWLRGRGWLVLDRLSPASSNAVHDYLQTWMLAPEFADSPVRFRSGQGGSCISAVTRDQPFSLHFFNVSAPIVHAWRGSDEPLAGWYSAAYAKRQPKWDVHVRWTGRGPQTVATWLEAPAADGAQVRETSRLPSASGLSLSLTFSDGAALACDISEERLAATLQLRFGRGGEMQFGLGIARSLTGPAWWQQLPDGRIAPLADLRRLGR
jgi:hypothetical protein